MNRILAAVAMAGAVATAATPDKASLMEPIAISHVQSITLSRFGACASDADGGVVGSVTSTRSAGLGSTQGTCWETRAVVVVPLKDLPGMTETVTYIAPTDADLIPTIEGMISGRVLPGIASQNGYALAP